MKYTHSITIQLPREEVVKKFSNPDNFRHWQRGFVYFKQIRGGLGEAGSTNKLKYKMGKREVEMVETILRNDLPEEFESTYEAKGVYNIQLNRFRKIDESTTKWTSENEFKFSGFMMIIGWLMPGAFKKQSWQYMQDFKAFAEEGKSVAE